MKTLDVLHRCWFRAWNRLTSPSTDRRDSGSVTMENVIWAVAVIAIAAIVVLAITNFVQGQADLIKPAP
ncbi:MAG: hypothetical protein LBV06_09185 [Propionibacteriaceae bacterium]|jgi:hypothetical protein|nr:hypothetical protein [Propionibacteriaceae bacterium]